MAKEETTQPAPTSHGFFTTGAFATLAGATAGVVIITNVVDAVYGVDYPKWIPLILSVCAAFAAYFYAAKKRPSTFKETPILLRYPIVILNGCLIYITAFGVQGVVASEAVTVEEESTEIAETPDAAAPSATSIGPRNRSVSDLSSSVRSLSTWSSVLSTSSPTKLRRDRGGR